MCFPKWIITLKLHSQPGNNQNGLQRVGRKLAILWKATIFFWFLKLNVTQCFYNYFFGSRYTVATQGNALNVSARGEYILSLVTTERVDRVDL